MSGKFNENSETNVATFYVPSRLSHLAASAVIRLLVYEDYEDCNFYRWDPVIIWQFETHQPKKKKAILKMAMNPSFGHPPPPWKGIKKLRDWWFGEGCNILGPQLESSLRFLLLGALERRSWTSYSEEETLLFLFLQICMDTYLHFWKKCIYGAWFADVAQILDKLGPFPLQKMIIENDVFEGNTILLSTILQNAPNLQVLRISHWELSNEMLLLLSSYCPLLCEFSIHDMEPDVFMSQEAFFKCFFKGNGQNAVFECFTKCSEHSKEYHPEFPRLQVSFRFLKYVNMVFSVLTEKFLSMLMFFYPNVTLSTFHVSHFEYLKENIREASAKMPFVHFYGSTDDLRHGRFNACLRRSVAPKELRLDVDMKCPGLDAQVQCDRVFEEASVNLKEVFREKSTIDALAIKPHLNVNVTRVVLPAFSAYGSVLKSLYFVYGVSDVVVNTLYQLLNLCPTLEKLVLEMDFGAKDCSSKAFRTELNSLPYLDTLVFLESRKEEDDDDEEEQQQEQQNVQNGHVEISDDPLAYSILLKDILAHSPNIRNLSFQLPEDFDTVFVGALSQSVETLQLTVQDGKLGEVLENVLPALPKLSVLSLQSNADEIWPETLSSLGRKGIRVTRKRLEFTNIFRWNDRRHNFDYNATTESNTFFWHS